MDSLNGALGERLSRFLVFDFSQIGIELPEVLGAKLCQFEIAQDRQEAVDVLPLPGQSRLGQLAGGDGLEPQLRVLCQRDGAVHLLRQALALPFEQDRLFVQPFLLLLGCQSFRRMDGLLFGLDAISLVVVTHGDYQQVAASPFSNTCHVVLTSLSLASFQLRPVLQAQHTASA